MARASDGSARPPEILVDCQVETYAACAAHSASSASGARSSMPRRDSELDRMKSARCGFRGSSGPCRYVPIRSPAEPPSPGSHIDPSPPSDPLFPWPSETSPSARTPSPRYVPPAVVLEPDDRLLLPGEFRGFGGSSAEGADRRIALQVHDDSPDEPVRAGRCLGGDVEDARPEEFADKGRAVGVPQVLVPAAHGEERGARADDVPQPAIEPLEAGGHGHLLAVGPATHEDDVRVGRPAFRVGADGTNLDLHAAPSRPLDQRAHVSAVAVQVEQLGEEVGDDERLPGERAAHRGVSATSPRSKSVCRNCSRAV